MKQQKRWKLCQCRERPSSSRTTRRSLGERGMQRREDGRGAHTHTHTHARTTYVHAHTQHTHARSYHGAYVHAHVQTDVVGDHLGTAQHKVVQPGLRSGTRRIVLPASGSERHQTRQDTVANSQILHFLLLLPPPPPPPQASNVHFFVRPSAAGRAAQE
jgi:hypothetical protein